MSDEKSAKEASTEGVLLGLALAYFGAYQLFKLPVVLPVLLEEYKFDRTLAGGFMSVYAVAGLVLSVWIGKRVEHRGPYGAVIVALGLMVLANLLTLSDPSNGALVLGCRGLEGVSFAVLAISGPVLANKFAGPKVLPLIIGLTAMWIPTGQLSATLIATSSVDHYGWPVLWYTGIVGSMLLALWCYRFSRRSAARKAAARDHTLVTASLSATQRRALLLSSVIFLLWSGQYFAYMTWLPQYLIEVHDTGLSGALFSYLIPVVALMVFNIVTGLALRAGCPVGKLLIGALLGQLLVWCLLPWTTSTTTGLVSLVVYGIGAGIAPTCLFAMPNTVLGPAADKARAFGTIMTGRNMGVLLGPIVLAQLFELMNGWHLAAPVFSVWTGLALVLGLALTRELARIRTPA